MELESLLKKVHHIGPANRFLMLKKGHLHGHLHTVTEQNIDIDTTLQVMSIMILSVVYIFTMVTAIGE